MRDLKPKDKKKVSTASVEITKKWTFNHGTCVLPFTLRIDIPDQIDDFIELLEIARLALVAEAPALKEQMKK